MWNSKHISPLMLSLFFILLPPSSCLMFRRCLRLADVKMLNDVTPYKWDLCCKHAYDGWLFAWEEQCIKCCQLLQNRSNLWAGYLQISMINASSSATWCNREAFKLSKALDLFSQLLCLMVKVMVNGWLHQVELNGFSHRDEKGTYY